MSHNGSYRTEMPVKTPLKGGSERERRREMMLNGPVTPTLLKLAGPMVLGMVAVMAFNLVDTYFVGQLGTLELAAMSFTFPVIYVVMSISMGMQLWEVRGIFAGMAAANLVIGGLALTAVTLFLKRSRFERAVGNLLL